MTGTGAYPVEAYLYNTSIGGQLSVTGALATVFATTSSLPPMPQIHVSGGGRIFKLDASLMSVDANVTAVAGGQAAAYAITDDFTNVTTVLAADDGVVLPSSVIGFACVVKNNGANELKRVPAARQRIDALALNAAYTLAAGTATRFVCVTTTNWQHV